VINRWTLSTSDVGIRSGLALEVAGERRLFGPTFEALFTSTPRMFQPDALLVVVLPVNYTRFDSLLSARLQSEMRACCRIFPSRCGNRGGVHRGSCGAMGLDGPRGDRDRYSFIVHSAKAIWHPARELDGAWWILVQGVEVKWTSALLEIRWNWDVVNMMVCIDRFAGIGRAPRLIEKADVAFPVALVDLADPSLEIFVLVGALKPDAARMDSLALVPLDLELFADWVTVAVGIGELENLDLVFGSIDASEGEDGSGDKLKVLACSRGEEGTGQNLPG
jgi:hypothetical protein